MITHCSMKILLLSLLTLNIALAQTLLTNEREGTSFFLRKTLLNDRSNSVEDLYSIYGVDSSTFDGIKNDITSKIRISNACVTDLHKNIKESFLANYFAGYGTSQNNFNDVNFKFSTVLKAIRSENIIDDVTLDILLKYNQVKSQSFKIKRPNLKIADDKKQSLIRIFKKLESPKNTNNRKRNICAPTKWREVYMEFAKLKLKDSNIQLKKYLTYAYLNEAISKETLFRSFSFFKADVQSWKLSLKTYLDKKKKIDSYLRVKIYDQALTDGLITQKQRIFLKLVIGGRANLIPENDRKEVLALYQSLYQEDLKGTEGLSDFISSKAKKQKVSHRVRLYESYDVKAIFQLYEKMVIMKDIITSNKVVINTYSEEEIIDSYQLAIGGESLRYALKRIQVELNNLAEVRTFGGTPQYTDAIAAAFELRLFNAESIDKIAAYEEIWNPTQSFLDKAYPWLKVVGSSATMLVPAGFGFIPMLVMAGADAFMYYKKGKESNFAHSLF